MSLLLGSIKGFSPNSVQEVQKNFYYAGDLVIANKFLDPMINIGGQQGTSGTIMQVINGNFVIVNREFSFEYGMLRPQSEIDIGGKQNAINYLQYNMHIFPDYSFNEIKNILSLILFVNNSDTGTTEAILSDTPVEDNEV